MCARAHEPPKKIIFAYIFLCMNQNNHYILLAVHKKMKTTSVLYVHRHAAKTVKSLLEEQLLLDKRFRMVPTSADAIVLTYFDNRIGSNDYDDEMDSSPEHPTEAQQDVSEISASKCIAVPVTDACISRFHQYTGKCKNVDTTGRGVHNTVTSSDEVKHRDNQSWVIHVVASGTQTCPFSTSLGNQNRRAILEAPKSDVKLNDSGTGVLVKHGTSEKSKPASSLTNNVQYALIETLISCNKHNQKDDHHGMSSYREMVEYAVKTLNIRTCPKKLEVIGDDRTLVLASWAFFLEKDIHNNCDKVKSTSFQKGGVEFYDFLLKLLFNESGPLSENSLDKSKLQQNDLSPLYDIQSKLWENLAQVHKCSRVVRRGDIDPESGVRESGHRILWPVPKDSEISSGDMNNGFMPKSTGPNSLGWITVTEHKICQSFDLTRVMFSRGNVTEKKRFGSLVQPGERVLDMYAGIGYYTLPALVHGKAKHVTACEWNPHALNALRYNLKANRVDAQSTVLEGDCRVSLRALIAQSDGNATEGNCQFDRISLGLLPSSEGGWAIAVTCLCNNFGGWLHVHANVLTVERQNWTHWLCLSLIQIVKRDHPHRKNWHAVCTHVEKVKSFAPKVDHVVADVFVGPSHSPKMPRNEENCTTGVVDSFGNFKLTPFDTPPPSCALSKEGVLHQHWLMDNE